MHQIWELYLSCGNQLARLDLLETICPKMIISIKQREKHLWHFSSFEQIVSLYNKVQLILALYRDIYKQLFSVKWLVKPSRRVYDFKRHCECQNYTFINIKHGSVHIFRWADDCKMTEILSAWPWNSCKYLHLGYCCICSEGFETTPLFTVIVELAGWLEQQQVYSLTSRDTLRTSLCNNKSWEQ